MWETEQENLLKDWAEKARYYAWMHHKSHLYYTLLTNRITVPLVVISTITSSANFTMVGFEHTKNGYLSIVFPLTMGVMSMIAAILSTGLKTFRTTEMATEHFAMYKHYNSLFRNITLDLSLPPDQRKPPQEMCNVYRYDFDRLINESPTIPGHVVEDFNRQFPCAKNKPEITNDFGKIIIYGRNQMLACSETMLRKIRSFYKYRYFALNGKPRFNPAFDPEDASLESISVSMSRFDDA